MKAKQTGSTDPPNSENSPSEEFKNFEDFSKRMGQLTRKELDTILEKEKPDSSAKRKRKRRSN